MNNKITQITNFITFCDAMWRIALPVLWILLAIAGCSDSNSVSETTTPRKNTLFALLPASQTGIDFKNTITESDTLNILNEAYLYNGGGVGIGDFNNDGWADVYFSANMVSNKLYLNKGLQEGAIKFEDITEVAGVSGKGRWCTGVSVVDINADGWLDMYVSATFLKDSLRRKNLLYINQGNNENGVPVFKESAEAYGLADTGYSTQGVFFDYDKDGDLDVYVLTNALDDPKTPIRYRPKITDGTAINTDRLYRNDTPLEGGSRRVFSNVSEEAGILIEGFGHAVAVTDINLDGWPDMYVSNDFVANDILYVNNRDGTFTDRITDYFKHTGWYAMGTDAADINNDGFVDLVSLEMLPEDNMRKKRMLGGNEYHSYFNNRQYDYQHQYIRNVLQLNTGMTPKGHPAFSEVGYMAGVYQTDWSWAPLVADFDNDGFRDMIITNGLPRDVTDLDYSVYENGQDNYGGKTNATLEMVEKYFPSVNIPNYGFSNTGGFLFADSTQAWGLNHPSFSNGGAYADLDNDGDLDLVVNNINQPAFVYENTLNSSRNDNSGNYLSVKLQGTAANTQGTGAILHIYYNGDKQQIYEHQPCRGYLSTVDASAHFGLGAITIVDSLKVQWPDGKQQLLINIQANQTLTVSYKNAVTSDGKRYNQTAEIPLLQPASTHNKIKFRHQERNAIDYNIQRILPHKLSQYGPGIAVGDIDNNGYDDFFVGGSAGFRGVFFMQDRNGNFAEDSTRIVDETHSPEEDMGVLFFDADNDHDLDLYIVSGSYEFQMYVPEIQDRLYLNNGKGKFRKSETALPKMFSHGSCVKAADFDRDGDLDLFIGGRLVPGSYPSAPESFLLENRDGLFIDVTQQYCPSLQRLGMITDALWSDFDQDGRVDLVVTGEWMPVTFYKNTGEALIPVNSTGIDQHLGWWNSLASGDFDNDGDTDYVVGNLGLNSNYKASFDEPMTLFAKDLTGNGLMYPMVFCYMKAEDGTRKLFPMHTRDDMMSQLISIRKEYPTYASYGRATVDELWGEEERKDAMKLIATDLTTSYIENKGNGQFAIKSLPIEAQVAPVYGMLTEDINDDGNLDLLLVGNDYGMEPISGRHDALMGLCLLGDGKGNFQSMPITKSGFFVKGDAKGLAKVHSARGEDWVVATQNQDSLVVYSKKENHTNGDQPEWIALNQDDFYADIVYKDNRKRRVEFYYGDTYLSQSSRMLKIAPDMVKVIITDFRGNKREAVDYIMYQNN